MTLERLPIVAYNFGFMIGYEASPLRGCLGPAHYQPPGFLRRRQRLHYLRGFVAGAMAPSGRDEPTYKIWPAWPVVGGNS